MTKFEEEVKRPKKAYIDPFSKRDVDFTELAKKFTEGAQTLKEWKEYAFLLEDKLKLQQQALPVVPDFIGKLINTFGAPEDGKHINYSASYLEIQKELDWIDNHQKTWLTALLIGFRVEKPQLFEVKMPIVYWDDDASQLTNGFDFLRIDKETDEVDFVGFLSNTKKHTVHFTEQEIKSIDERYWQFAVPVEVQE
ncbi:MAG: DUF1642 domain-containing protein [Lactococcus lactis]|nr:DUF1642 domain-containing protein [Lactococcus lactis]MDU2186526.1 DUF1642 domain-containing protein [Lactococcus lactis]MDU3960671.1 DUF1642 domain-containing protein [Lactococcus lactis]MDU4037918.1 DUF1642 domain-containing protein [Lactococcus lactis]MDU4517987.1 DUF1642 domain-containing protein [Lactococcus lactis]